MASKIKKLNVLVVGGGGREHALTWAISKSRNCGELYCAPGNGGIADVAICINIAAEDLRGLVEFALNNAIDLVVVGPEGPLVAGLVDRLEEKGIKAFGPGAKAAMLEGSKGLTKDLCRKYNIPTADYARFDKCDAAKEYVRIKGAPVVIKADGLAAGKGVILCRNENEAYAAIDHIMTELAFGEAGAEIVIEDFLSGEEISFFALVDGEHAIPLVAAQDHKAAFDGDEGPNTGGMGAYSPAPVVDESMVATIMETIIAPTIKGMKAEKMPYKGVLFAGLMLTDDGPQLIEYNCRFGDPECQTLIMRLESDMLDVLLAATDGKLKKVSLKWRDETALTVVMATQGYPDKYQKGSEIRCIPAAEGLDGVMVFHASTRRNGDAIIANGGRVLGVTALAPSAAEAQKLAYQAVSKIDWPEGFNRTDIGWRAINLAKS